MKPHIAIILVNYNNEYHTIECLHSLAKISYRNIHIIVVDNGSKDSSVESLRKEHAGVEIISAHKNLGFAGANNVGIQKALSMTVDYILMLNNDTVVDSGFLEPLVDAMEGDSTLGAVSGTICYHPDVNRIWYAGGEFLSWRAAVLHRYEGKEYQRVVGLTPTPITFITGCLFLMRADAVRKIGLLDEKLFMYYEDLEYSLRLQKNGYELKYIPSSRIYHKIKHQGNTPFTVYYGVRSRLVFMDLCLSGVRKIFARVTVIASILIRLIQWRISSPRLVHAAIVAIKDYRAGVYGIGWGSAIRYPE